jgi:hypothetical protein
MNVTALVFLVFAGFVAFAHILVGEWEYIIPMVPFAVAFFMKDKASRWVETMGLFSIGLYTLIVQYEYIGMVILFTATTWFFVYIDRKVGAWVVVVSISIIIGTAAYYRYDILKENRLMAAAMDMMFYAVGASLFLFTLKNLVRSVRAEMHNMDQKSFDIIERLQGALHEAIDTLKTDVPHDGPRKNC